MLERLLSPTSFGIRQRPTLPGRLQPSTIGAWRLNFCVRHGNRWNPPAIATGNCISLSISRAPLSLPALRFRFALRISLPPPLASAPDRPLAHPQNRTVKADLIHYLTRTSFQDQALDRLVSASSIRYRTSTADLSTLSSARGLTCSRSGNLLLQVGFTLRCLQRLSLPHFASQLCRWHDNCCTSGASIPVLSY